MNLTINITSPIYVGLIIENNSIYFENLNLNNDLSETLSFNLTQRNISYLGTDLPYFTSSTSTSKIIRSNISVNATIIISLDCNRIYSIKYTQAGGTTQVYTGNQAQSICGQLTSTGYELQINPSSESNVLEFTYGCSSSGFERIGYQLILLAGALLIIGTVLALMFNRGILQEMTVGQLILLFIAITVGIALLMASADNIAGVCRV